MPAAGDRRGPRGVPICQGCNGEAIGPAARRCVRCCWTPDRDLVGEAVARRLGLLPPLALGGQQLALVPPLLKPLA